MTTTLRNLSIGAVFLIACDLAYQSTNDPLATVSDGSGSGSGSDAGTCPSCGSGSAGCCDGTEPYAQAPSTTTSTSLSLEELAALNADDPEAVFTDTTNGCTQNLPALPAGCMVFRGDGRWLYCWMNGYTTPVGCLTAGGVNASCEMSDDQINAAAAACNMQTSSQGRLGCVIDQVRGVLGGWGNNGNVCRHFARCFKKVYEAMGYSQSVTTHWFGGNGHTFNLVDTTGGGRYYCDASNNILLWCP